MTQPAGPAELDARSNHFLRLSVRACTGDRPIFVSGLEVDADDVWASNRLLPAVLIAAALNWAPVCVRQEGRNGFELSLATDPSSLLGFRVAECRCGSPAGFISAVLATLNGCRTGDEYQLDPVLRQFGRWLMSLGMSAERIDEVESRLLAHDEMTEASRP